jgi:hypothetical protein
MKDTRNQCNYGLLGKMTGGCLPYNRLKEPSSQKELLDKITATFQVDQEKFLKATLEGGCVKTTFDEEKCKFEFKYISKMEMIKPSNALESDTK